MPASAIHMSIAKKINKKLNKNEFEFLIGNIAPDCWRHSLLYSDKYISHFSEDIIINNIPQKIENYSEFLKKYKDNINDSFTLGYLIHLMTDNYWKKNVTSRYQIIIDDELAIKTKDNKYFFGSKESIKEYLHINNEIATINISRHYNLKPIILEKNIECNIEEIDLSGLINTINHINNINAKKTNEISTIYEMEDLYNDIDKCCDFILKELENLI